MSRGAGAIERRIADLFAATRDRALSVDEIAGHAFRTKKPTRSQRLSATRATHRLLGRVREMRERGLHLIGRARANADAALGPWCTTNADAYRERLDNDPAHVEGVKLVEAAGRIGTWRRPIRTGPGTFKVEADYWCTITLNRRLYFHPPDAPMQVWAVTIDGSGVHWFDAEVTKITQRNVMVRY
jgi:hypothetical protein